MGEDVQNKYHLRFKVYSGHNAVFIASNVKNKHEKVVFGTGSVNAVKNFVSLGIILQLAFS
jgi:hypothetical protein